MPEKWVFLCDTNTGLSRKTMDFIISIAVLYDVDVIAMEHLDTCGRKFDFGKQRLPMWKKKAAQNQTELQFHRLEVCISHEIHSVWRLTAAWKSCVDKEQSLVLAVTTVSRPVKYTTVIWVFPITQDSGGIAFPAVYVIYGKIVFQIKIKFCAEWLFMLLDSDIMIVRLFRWVNDISWVTHVMALLYQNI